MDGWIAGRTRVRIKDILSGVGGGGPGPTARIQDRHMEYIHTYVRLTYIHACTHTYIHTHVQTGT